MAHAEPRGRFRRRATVVVLGALAFVVTAASCGSDAPTPPPEVTRSDAYRAIVDWELTEHPPVVDEAGEEILPVIYLAAEAGGTVDIGVQAEVVEATSELAVIRFSDNSDEALDDGLEGIPVRDEGVLFVLGELPAGERLVDAPVRRYASADDNVTYMVTFRATSTGTTVTSVVDRDEQSG